MDCIHDWKLRPNGIKEGCSKCGAARVYDPKQCSHEWKERTSGKKMGCIKCGAAIVVLDVQDVKVKQQSKIMGE